MSNFKKNKWIFHSSNIPNSILWENQNLIKKIVDMVNPELIRNLGLFLWNANN